MDRSWNKAGIIIGTVVAVAGAAYLLVRNRFLPQARGMIKLTGITDKVEILRDRWGIPHIYARNEADLMFAQGFVHAQDRLWQMDFQRRMVAGRLAEVLGEPALQADRWLRILCMRRAAEKDELLVPAKTRNLLEAYMAGINSCINQGHLPLEFTLLGYTPEPWTIVDSLSWGKMMAWTLSANWEVELLRSQLINRLGPELAAQLEPGAPPNEPFIIPPGTEFANIGDLSHARVDINRKQTGPAGGQGLGSNNWVIAGSRTTTGKPLLANDMHLLMSIPAIWYENHLVCDDLELSGVTLPGVPGIVAGHNRHVAWGYTNGFPDVQDLYMEHLTRTDQGQVQYEFQGKWVDAEVLQELIRLKDGTTVNQEVILTRHGPIINQLSPDLCGETPLALRWTALDPETLFQALHQMNRAKSCLEFREALRLWGTPSQNTVYADTAGNIGYTQTGRVPIRTKGDGRLPVPGWTGEYEWDAFIPFDELPHLYNPPEGYIVTANNRVVDKNYPHFLGNDYITANRAQRIRELIDARSKIDIAYIQEMHFDQLSPHARTIAGFLAKLETDDVELKSIIERMRKWEGNLRPDSPEASIYQVFYRHLILQMTSNKLGDLAKYYLGKGPVPFLAETSLLGEHAFEWLEKTLSEPDSAWFIPGEGKERDDMLLAVLRQSVDELKDKLGPQVDTWHWKKLHKIRFAHTLGSVKPLDRLFNRGPYPLGGDSNTIWNTATGYNDLAVDQVVGPPFRFIADLSDLEHCYSILAPGQSGSPLSRHYADQLKAWFNRGYHPMIFNRKELEPQVENRLILIPETKDANQKQD